MKIVYIISRYTSANRSSKDHADDGTGKPLCGDKPRGRFNGWSQDEGEVTCSRCKQLLEEQKLMTHRTFEITADPKCRSCGGTGFETQRHPYGSTWATEYLTCDCISEQLPEDFDDRNDKIVIIAAPRPMKYEEAK